MYANYMCLHVKDFPLVIRELLLAWQNKFLAEVMYKYVYPSKSKLYFAENSLWTQGVKL